MGLSKPDSHSKRLKCRVHLFIQGDYLKRECEITHTVPQPLFISFFNFYCNDGNKDILTGQKSNHMLWHEFPSTSVLYYKSYN